MRFEIGDEVKYIQKTSEENLIVQDKIYKVTGVYTDHCCIKLGITVGILNQGVNAKGEIILVQDAIKNGNMIICPYCKKDNTKRNIGLLENIFSAENFENLTEHYDI